MRISCTKIPVTTLHNIKVISDDIIEMYCTIKASATVLFHGLRHIIMSVQTEIWYVYDLEVFDL